MKLQLRANNALVFGTESTRVGCKVAISYSRVDILRGELEGHMFCVCAGRLLFVCVSGGFGSCLIFLLHLV
jgi:hypothetical protein